jgi:pyruvate dehydrogenase E1 component alpha subunit
MRLDASQQDLARQVLQIRYWQHLVNESLKKGTIRIPLHVAFGHEAIAVAVSEMMQPGDALALSHRNIAYNLARAGDPQTVFDEYRLSSSGAAHGKLGSMNLANPDRGVVYTSSILGNNMPVTCGLALSMKVLRKPNIAIVCTGDGAMEEGTFHESLTLSKSQKLRCLFVIENNKYAMSSTIAERRCPIDISHICKAVDAPYFKLSGNDVFEYRDHMVQFRELLLRDPSPACVEVDLANVNRHAGPTPGWPTDPMNIDLKRGLIIQESAYDPVHVLKQKLDASVYNEIEHQVLARSWSL